MNMDFLLEFIGDASPWLLILLIPLYFWGKLNYSALQNRESHPDSYQRAVNWLREDNVGQLYLQFLGRLMDGVSRLIGDRHKFGQAYATSVNHRGFIHKTFGFNPFTPESYIQCFRISLFYPFSIFLLLWAVFGISNVGKADFPMRYENMQLYLRGIVLLCIYLFLLFSVKVFNKGFAFQTFLVFFFYALFFVFVCYLLVGCQSNLWDVLGFVVLYFFPCFICFCYLFSLLRLF